MPDQRQQDPNRRPTKAEKRDEARRKRVELERQLATRKRRRVWGTLALVLAAALVVGLIIVDPFAGPTPQDVLAQAAAATSAAGCDDVQTVEAYGGLDAADPESQDRTHIGAETFPTPPPLSSYPSTPPASGPHDPTPLPGGVYESPPSVYRTIHSLEHGAAIVWYSPSISAEELAALKDFYSQKVSAQNVSQDRVIVAPYDYPDQGAAGKLPAGVGMALVSWHELQTCTRVSLPAAFDFTSQYAFPTFDDRAYKGQSPPEERGSAL